MIVTRVLEQTGLLWRRGIVFAAGGSADIILAKTIASGLVREGSTRVDLAQPLNCEALSDKGLLSKAGEHHVLTAEDGLYPELVLRHRTNLSGWGYGIQRHQTGPVRTHSGATVSRSRRSSRWPCETSFLSPRLETAQTWSCFRVEGSSR